MSQKKSLDHLCRIRARLLDLDDDGRLDACSAARLGDVEAEIAAIRETRAVRFRETDPGWARLEELARQVLAAADPPKPRPTGVEAMTREERIRQETLAFWSMPAEYRDAILHATVLAIFEAVDDLGKVPMGQHPGDIVELHLQRGNIRTP